MKFLQYFLPMLGVRTALARRNSVRYLDAGKKTAFAPSTTPSEILERIGRANKIVVPIHGYQPQAWLWAEPFEEGAIPPYGNYGAQSYCDGISGALERAAGGSLGDDVFTIYPIWASNELWYTSTVRENAEWAGAQLAKDLATFQERFPDKEVEIVAHSAGGLVAQKALVDLSKSPSGKLGKIRQTLLNPDVPSDAFGTGETADAIGRLYGTILVHDPSDRALLGARIAAKHHPLDKHVQSGETGLPSVVTDDLETGTSPHRTAGREGLSGTLPGNVTTSQVSLPGALKHTGHADRDWLQNASDPATVQAMDRLWRTILERHT